MPGAGWSPPSTRAVLLPRRAALIAMLLSVVVSIDVLRAPHLEVPVPPLVVLVCIDLSVLGVVQATPLPQYRCLLVTWLCWLVSFGCEVLICAVPPFCSRCPGYAARCFYGMATPAGLFEWPTRCLHVGDDISECTSVLHVREYLRGKGGEGGGRRLQGCEQRVRGCQAVRARPRPDKGRDP